MKKVIILIFILAFSLNAQDSSKVVVTWDLNTDIDIFGYNVFIGEASRNYTYSEFVKHPKDRNEFWQLSKGKTYYFAVTAIDTAGNESGFSNEVFLTITDVEIDTTAPNIVTSVSVGELTEAQFINLIEKFNYKIIKQ